MIFVGLGAGIVFRHRCEPFVPVGHRMDDAVGFGRAGDFSAPMLLRQLEGIAHDPVAAAAGEHRLLGGKLVLGAAIESSANFGIFALDVFAHDEEIDIAGHPVPQWRNHAFQQPDGAQIDILVELPPDRDQHVPQGDMVGHAGPADRAEEDRVMLAQLVDPVGRHEIAERVVCRAVPRELGPVERDAEFLARRVQHTLALGQNLLADAVTGNHRDLVARHICPRFLECSRLSPAFVERKRPASWR